ncbi:radical SAM protein [Streptomyces sp. NPDC088354]|uniref:radical SAM protein n=1 Tax=unclassified Streptomyces TaxID=2593676 RepID=UPI0029B0D016|nr:radical SAM protein [Streptomyces sp. MI02-7b]MDX3073609.1 radical SAM protein [Streptomyces sp. MI02-7b]
MPASPLRLPAYVDFRPLGRCNLSCPFCFGPRHEVPTMSRQDAFRVADVLREAGVRGIVVSGGEPTLLPYLAELLAELGRADHPSGTDAPRVVLSTNGLARLPVMRRVLPHLSWIALPLESADAREHAALRTGVAPHRERVLALLKEVRRSYDVKVKLGTVITRRNLGGAPDVLRLIEDDDCLPDVWKIYQMSETNYGADNSDWLSVSEWDFEEALSRCEKAAADRGVTLEVYRNKTRSGSYLFVDPDCRVVVIKDGAEHRIGHLFEEREAVARGIGEMVESDSNADNFTRTYPDLPGGVT